MRALEAEVQALTQRLRDSEASLNAQEATNNAAIREMEGQHTEALAALASTHLTQLTSLVRVAPCIIVSSYSPSSQPFCVLSGRRIGVL